jgi:hypothetical protein
MPFVTLRWSLLNQLKTGDLRDSLVMKGISYISKKAVSKVLSAALFLSHSLHRDIVRKAFNRGFAVAGDERPEGFVWAPD